MDKRSLVARFAYELMRNDPSFLIYSAQSVRGDFSPYMHQQLLLWRLSVINPVKVLIGDEIGLGKTIEGILTIHRLRERGAKRFLVLVPKILKEQWLEELRKFFPETEVFSLKRENLEIYCRHDAPEGVYVVSIDTAKKDRNSRLIRRVKWDAIIVDEAHNLGSDSQRDKFVRSLEVEHKIFLSATPHRGDSKRYLRLLKHLDDNIDVDYKFDSPSFYIKTHNSILHRRTKNLVNKIEGMKVFTDCRVFAVVTEATEIEKAFGNNITDFLASILKKREEYSPIGLLVAILRKRVSSSPRAAMNTLERIIQPSEGARAVKETVIEKILGESYEDLSEALEEFDANEVDEVYEAVIEKYKDLLTPGEINRLSEFMEMVKRIEREKDSKLEALKDILNVHIAKGEKVIVFTEYKDTLKYLAEKLAEYDPVTVYGGLGEDKLRRRFEEFLTEKNVLIATDVASEGLNLQVANVIVNYEPPWTPIKLEQRMGRVWRIKQKKDVYVYNLFLGIRADIELAEILYKKMMCISEALSDVKNIIGEDIQLATTRTIESTEEMIDTFTLPTSIKYRNKVGRLSEYHLIKAQLEGELDEFVEAIMNRIRELKVELSRKRVYPLENHEVVKQIGERLGLVSKGENEKLIAEAVGYALRRELPAHLKPQTSLRDLERVGRDIPEYIMVIGEGDEVDYIGVAEVDFGSHKLRIPLVYSSRDVLLGAKALKYVLDVVRKGIVPDEVFTEETLMPSEYAVKNRLEDKLQLLIRPFRDYGMNVEIKNIKLNILTKVLKLSGETLQSSKNYASLVGHTAEKFAENYERCRGFEVENRQTLRMYDLYSFNPSEAHKPEGMRESERYIEVKGHGKGGLDFLDLPEDEFEFGKKMGEKYWLYIVWNVLEGKPVLVGFKNPLNRKDLLEFKVKEKEIVIKKRVYEIRFKVD
ncbi:helicase-related protein [Archaeoglobus sp.]